MNIFLITELALEIMGGPLNKVYYKLKLICISFSYYRKLYTLGGSDTTA
jgi:hypothetical protein